MLSLPDRASMQHALTLSLEPDLVALLTRHTSGELIDLTHIVVVEAGDIEADLQREVGFSPLTNPLDASRFGSTDFCPWWDELRRRGNWFELILTVGNSGFAFVLLIPDREGVEPQLLDLCRRYGEEP